MQRSQDSALVVGLELWIPAVSHRAIYRLLLLSGDNSSEQRYVALIISQSMLTRGLHCTAEQGKLCLLYGTAQYTGESRPYRDAS